MLLQMLLYVLLLWGVSCTYHVTQIHVTEIEASPISLFSLLAKLEAQYAAIL